MNNLQADFQKNNYRQSEITHHISSNQIEYFPKDSHLLKKEKNIYTYFSWERKKIRQFFFFKIASLHHMSFPQTSRNNNTVIYKHKNKWHTRISKAKHKKIYIRHLYRTHVSHTWTARRTGRRAFSSPISVTFSTLFDLLKWPPDSPNDGFRWGLWAARPWSRN